MPTGRTTAALCKSIADLTGMTPKQVKAIMSSYIAVAAEELRTSGKFKFGGMLNLRLKEKFAVPARQGINPFTKQPCVFKARPASKTVRTSPLKQFKLLLEDDASTFPSPTLSKLVGSASLKRPATKRSLLMLRPSAAKKVVRPVSSKAVAWAKSHSRVSEEDRDAELHVMIQASKDGDFKKVFAILKKYPPYVNERPAMRRYSVIHQVCYWGELPILKRLVEDHGADVLLETKDGQSAEAVAREHGHTACADYLVLRVRDAAMRAPVPRRASSGDERSENRTRLQTTRADGGEGDELTLDGLQRISLKLGAEGGGTLCGAALVYKGEHLEKAVCYSDKDFLSAVHHSGDMQVRGRTQHHIELDLMKMPREVSRIYLTLCSCGVQNLQCFDNPFVELLGDDEQLIRYDLKDTGPNQSTVMASLQKRDGVWKAEPVGAVCAAKFCGNYSKANAVVRSL